MTEEELIAYQATVNWYALAGVDEAVAADAKDRTALVLPRRDEEGGRAAAEKGAPPAPQAAGAPLVGTAEYAAQALELAKAAATLDELAAAIAAFDGLGIKKTATNMVFADGNPAAELMLIGEAPGRDEDMQGKPFVGASGQLLDKILACIGLDRTADDPAKSVYITNILNWRPPRNRTPTPQETQIALPFIERHIALARPKYLLFCGGTAAQTLLARTDAISRLRGRAHAYRFTHPGLADGVENIPAIATYHPAYLRRTPSQKKLVWADMLLLQKTMEEGRG